ncbi:tRNA (N(6)-L-threonylcarbamoyladenosine(37)-C(2))-methylthiotransferase MtaB [Treponema paraluiscuniculi]|uniref:MiaB tRNA modification protein n=1 Tax=Treponema paraluiscuniculi TaxID=53435 RepID=A0ABY9E2I4_9SPIR|nr:tRNA (N(6)-L-threonylcarbamoyladenosine(37)-C(2))-methylthiotransferase MtaB [Treponema paraluiscuniculi]WKC72154.1 putative MiaB tRNA modification protein [Treponema paraluiscuniculi]
MFSVRIETLGCRLNHVESESLAALFLQEGFAVCRGNTSTAPVVLCVINTCTVTSKAEQKARRLVRLLLRTYPTAIALVTGCYAQLESASLEAMDDRVLAFPGKQKDVLSLLPSCLRALLVQRGPAPIDQYVCGMRALLASLKKKIISLELTSEFPSQTHMPTRNALPQLTGVSHAPRVSVSSFSEPTAVPRFALYAPRFLFHSRASIKVQDGCNSGCAFCRIRFARGRAVSLETHEIIGRVQALEARGMSEVVLTGVNLSQYRSGSIDFAGLLELIVQETHTIHIRISSLYPESVTSAFLRAIAHTRVSPHFHLSVQSGSDRVLRRMRRAYTRADIYQAVSDLRSVREEPFLGCDIIVGFPGETEEDFADTQRMCKTLRFAGIHVFPFSARPGTEAFAMDAKVPQRIAGERVAAMQQLAEKNYRAYLEYWNGRELCAVVEQSVARVLTENYLSLPIIERGGVAASAGSHVRIRVHNGGAILL